jgi:hypothetical protein
VAEGEAADRFYVITSGEVEVTQRSGDRDVYITMYAAGDHFGEVGLLESLPRNATVRAISSVKVLSLDQETFHQVVEQSESTAEQLAKVLKERSVPLAYAAPRDDAIPLPPLTRLMERVFKHPSAMHYNRLIALVLAVNAGVLWYSLSGGDWWSSQGADLAAIALVAQVNFGLAIILRQQFVINFLGWAATLPPTSWPLRLRWMIAKWYHFGGLHVGAAIAGTLWYAAFVGSLTYDQAKGLVDVPTAVLAISYAGIALFVVIIVMALPGRRTVGHDNFFNHFASLKDRAFVSTFFGEMARILEPDGNLLLDMVPNLGHPFPTEINVDAAVSEASLHALARRVLGNLPLRWLPGGISASALWGAYSLYAAVSRKPSRSYAGFRRDLTKALPELGVFYLPLDPDTYGKVIDGFRTVHAFDQARFNATGELTRAHGWSPRTPYFLIRCKR